ncbi:hypothetical protein [uncultured Paracoccus sp.]|uniref:hypothetical protein n=1 Tax=uncultured Paracoccus sp. TaxID=189685 RepID=UPI002627D5C5|nr:hypothetical protein [uncultured Paracoccus sp.]
MLDGHSHHEPTDLLTRSPREAVLHRIRPEERGHSADAAEIWRAPLHFGFTLGLIMARQVTGVR